MSSCDRRPLNRSLFAVAIAAGFSGMTQAAGPNVVVGEEAAVPLRLRTDLPAATSSGLSPYLAVNVLADSVQRRVHLGLTAAEPVLCADYSAAGTGPLRLSMQDGNGETQALEGVMAMAVNTAALEDDRLVMFDLGADTLCSSFPAGAAPAGGEPPLFGAGFEADEGLSDLVVEVEQGATTFGSVAPEVTYTITVRNEARNALWLQDVRLREFFPAQASGETVYLAASTCTLNAFACPPRDPGATAGIPESLNLGALAPGQEAVVELVRTVHRTGGGAFVAGDAVQVRIAVFADPNPDAAGYGPDRTRANNNHVFGFAYS